LPVDANLKAPPVCNPDISTPERVQLKCETVQREEHAPKQARMIS
jgi:hypothetical protein